MLMTFSMSGRNMEELGEQGVRRKTGIRKRQKTKRNTEVRGEGRTAGVAVRREEERQIE